MSNIDKLNPIGPSALTSVSRVQAASPAASEHFRQTVADGGKNMPSASQAGHMTEAQKKEIAKAAKDVSGYIQNISRELNFTVDEELERTVITVIDEHSGDVIRQIPNEDILELARNIAQMKDHTTKGMLFQGDA